MIMQGSTVIHVHQLDGCAPAPLANYLKALGILRLVSESGDSSARGWWDGNRFRLATTLTRHDLEGFFLHCYCPTPMFNPWGARSGFYSGSAEKGARESLEEIEGSSMPQLKQFREAIKMVRSVIPETKPSKQQQSRLALDLRLKARGASSLWLNTVISVIGSGNDVRLGQPPIFGTGGNEGSGGYPSAYMSAIVEALIKAKWNHAVPAALFGGSTMQCCWDQSINQFSPGGASTPWDMLLAFEGACTLRSSVGGRTVSKSTRWMSSPFYVAPRSFGYASGSRLDEKYLHQGRERPGRGEQWFPMWKQPSQFSEVQQIFSQGRAATKAGRATDGWAMARAVTGFGVSRGIPEFLRYGYQQRNNQATHFAVPLGRFRVPDAESVKSSCLDDLSRWVGVLHREVHPDDHQKATRVPARLTTEYRRLADAMFSIMTTEPLFSSIRMSSCALGTSKRS